MRIINYILIGVSAIVNTVLLRLLVRGKIHERFPFFFVFVAYSLAGTVGLLFVTAHYHVYFIAFWFNEAALAILAVLSLYEIFRKVFFGAEREFPWFRFVFPATIFLAMAFVIWQVGSHATVSKNPVVSGILLFGLLVNFIELGIFGLFLFLAHIFPLKWTLAPLGILLGFALDAIGSAIYYWLRSTFGNNLPDVFGVLPPVAYLVGLSVWLHTFWHPEPEPEWPSIVVMKQIAEQMRQETEVIRRFLGKVK